MADSDGADPLWDDDELWRVRGPRRQAASPACRRPSARKRSSSSRTARFEGAQARTLPFDASNKAASSFVFPVPGGPWMSEIVVSSAWRGAGALASATADRTASDIQSAVFSGRVHRVSRVDEW
mgnify:CR=1 FL=1